jgi:Tol biopolymer transport system component
MMVRPGSGDIYLLTKRESGASRIHKLKPAYGGANSVTQKIGELSVPAVPIGLLTGGSISPDGKRVALCDYQQGYELVLPPDVSDFDSIWKQKLVVVDLGKRKQGEGVTYSPDGNAIYASSENKNAPLMRVQRRS